ncbi:MAG: hypothetical protein HW389_3152 [Bacteroidetes bacterium]|nr:hypothetical protein [Bacteroidota bacterium]MBM2841205.1 hypothetical protein [Bacteroidota bacterium]
MNTINRVDGDRGRRRRLELILSAVLTVLIFLASVATAQVGTITIGGGNVTLNITTGAAGSQPVADVDATRTLRYWRKAAIAKVTVRSTCPTQAFTLKVLATGVVRGVAAPEVTLTDGMLAVDFITSIPSAAGWTSSTITLQYTASATFAQGNSAELGNDVHTVTYTLQVQ